jgi:hypothetical protein
MQRARHFAHSYSKLTDHGISLHKFCHGINDGFCHYRGFGHTASVRMMGARAILHQPLHNERNVTEHTKKALFIGNLKKVSLVDFDQAQYWKDN